METKPDTQKFVLDLMRKVQHDPDTRRKRLRKVIQKRDRFNPTNKQLDILLGINQQEGA